MKARAARLLGSAAIALATTLTSCGGSSASQAQTEFPGGVFQTAQSGTLFQQLVAGPTATAHSGLRLVELFGADGQPSVVYREAVGVDDQGNFALTPVDVVSGAFGDEQELLGTLTARAGYHFRYRDFQIRDLGRFVENYSITADTAASLEYLGRTVISAEIDPLEPGGTSFDLLVDADTGLVLASQTVDGKTGALLQRTSYVTFELGTPAGFEPHAASNQEQTLDLSQPLGDQLGFEPHLPNYLPAGYSAVGAATVVDPLGTTWFLLTCTDGVELLFVLERSMFGVTPDGLGTIASIEPLDSTGEDSILLGFESGRVRVIEGRLGKNFRSVVGTESFDELQLTLESTVF